MSGPAHAQWQQRQAAVERRAGQASGEVTRAAFPVGVNAPVHHGGRIAATAVYHQTAQFLPEYRLAELLPTVVVMVYRPCSGGRQSWPVGCSSADCQSGSIY